MATSTQETTSPPTAFYGSVGESMAIADAHIARLAAQTSPTFPVEFDDPDEDEDEESVPDATGDALADITRANAEDGERPE